MFQYLPISDFMWVEDLTLFTAENINMLDDDCNVGYILEVNLECPQELHDSRNRFPCAPESIVVP